LQFARRSRLRASALARRSRFNCAAQLFARRSRLRASALARRSRLKGAAVCVLQHLRGAAA